MDYKIINYEAKDDKPYIKISASGPGDPDLFVEHFFTNDEIADGPTVAGVIMGLVADLEIAFDAATTAPEIPDIDLVAPLIDPAQIAAIKQTKIGKIL